MVNSLLGCKKAEDSALRGGTGFRDSFYSNPAPPCAIYTTHPPIEQSCLRTAINVRDHHATAVTMMREDIVLRGAITKVTATAEQRTPSQCNCPSSRESSTAGT